jgi:DDB1- and CUL4-associated factor 7
MNNRNFLLSNEKDNKKGVPQNPNSSQNNISFNEQSSQQFFTKQQQDSDHKYSKHPQQFNSQKKNKESYKYQAPWLISSVGFSHREDQAFRLAITSFIENEDNKAEIIKVNSETNQLEVLSSIQLKTPATKVMWIPDPDQIQFDLFATSDTTLKIWEINEDGQVIQKSDLEYKSKPEFPAPLTSFDWSPSKFDMIVTSSIDCTCSVWNVPKETLYYQIVAHDREVYDVSFSTDERIFASVGADGSLRMFDMNSPDNTNILYESEGNAPLLRVAWNKRDPNLIACVEMDKYKISVIDIRKPLTPYTQLLGHQGAINSISWSTSQWNKICSGSDDSLAMIWDIKDAKNVTSTSKLEYKARGPVSNVDWSYLQKDWVAVTVGKMVEVLSLE